MPHQLRHGPTAYYGHLQGPVTHTPVAERFGSGPVPTCFYDLSLSRPEIEPRYPACEANAPPLRHRGGLIYRTYDVAQPGMNTGPIKFW